ncbi:glycosyl-transferase for dystroglycan-domain-containing protein [Zopfochytrium polystomum]|nr:glycosyl-transferase for dystroglycan-domain-containing protein [Zopfochytrium polystomum]
MVKPKPSLDGYKGNCSPTVRPSTNRSHWICFKYFTPSEIDTKVYHQDVTFVTLSTADRISGIDQILQQWSGLVNLAYYVKNTSDIGVVDRLVEECPSFRQRVTVHLLWAENKEPFPINTLRNLAEVGVKTSHVFHCDIDFVPSTKIREKLLLAHGKLLYQSTRSRLLLVVPSFELVPPGSKYPLSKNDTGGIEGLTIPPTEMLQQKPLSPANSPLGSSSAKFEGSSSVSGKAPNKGPSDENAYMEAGEAVREAEELESFYDQEGGDGQEDGTLKKRRGGRKALAAGPSDTSKEKSLQLPIPGYRSRSGQWRSKRTPKRNLTIPLVKEDARDMLLNYELRTFHARCRLCQHATDVARWIEATDSYPIERLPGQVSETYEPFVVIPTNSVSWNENFAGYGRDKTLYYYELRVLLQYQSVVLPDVFIVHKDHGPSEDAAKFREKYSLSYRTSRIKVYDREQDLLDAQYARKGLLPPFHSERVAARKVERATRDAILARGEKGISNQSQTIGDKRAYVTGARKSDIFCLFLLAALCVALMLKRKFRWRLSKATNSTRRQQPKLEPV